MFKNQEKGGKNRWVIDGARNRCCSPSDIHTQSFLFLFFSFFLQFNFGKKRAALLRVSRRCQAVGGEIRFSVLNMLMCVCAWMYGIYNSVGAAWLQGRRYLQPFWKETTKKGKKVLGWKETKRRRRRRRRRKSNKEKRLTRNSCWSSRPNVRPIWSTPNGSLSLSLSLSLALFFFFFTLAGQKDNKFDKDRRTDVDRKGWTAGERKKSKVSKRKKKRSSTWLRLAFRSRHARFHPYGVFFLRTIGKWWRAKSSRTMPCRAKRCSGETADAIARQKCMNHGDKEHL